MLPDAHREETAWPGTYDVMLQEWLGDPAQREPAPSWNNMLLSMTMEMNQLRAEGRWRTGGRTLLHELGVHHSEVLLCRGLAWLLTPDGWHGLGTRFLIGMLSALGLPSEGAEKAVVAVEETRGATRADVVVRLPEATLLIEAKVFAGEQQLQCDRLAAEWAHETPTLVFLTRGGTEPTSAVDSAGAWHTITWRQIATIAAAAAQAPAEPSHGALDFIETLEQYGG